MIMRIKPLIFIEQVKSEAKKIVWPTRREATISVISVCLMVFFASVFLFTVDRVIEFAVWRCVGLLEAIFG